MNCKQVIITALLVALASNPAGFFALSKQVDLQKQQLQEYSEQRRANTFKDKQMLCLREALWHEARGEPEEGIRAVATVILNRSYSDQFPGTICEVVNQRKQFSYVQQFKTKRKSTKINPTAAEVNTLKVVDKIVEEVYTSVFVAVVPPNVLWYHTVKVKPKWSKEIKLHSVIGQHIFRSK